MDSRELIFEGCYNSRDLGGLPTIHGSPTRFQFIVRSDEIDNFTSTDWKTLHNYGIGTLIDLRNEDEVHLTTWPSDFQRFQIPLDGGNDPSFWAEWKNSGKWCTPLYYKAHLQRFPYLTAEVVRTIARVDSGGVLVHCGAGRDRTGLISMILLLLTGVSSEMIAKDHSLSHANLSRRYRELNELDQNEYIEKLMQESGTSTHEIVIDILTSIDVKTLLLRNGCTESDLLSVKNRLVGEDKALDYNFNT